MSKSEEEVQPPQAVAASPVEALIPDLVALLESGVHFGHERSKRNPKMEQFIFALRNRVAIFDLEATRTALQKAATFAYNTARVPGNDILFVGTKRQARGIVSQWAESVKQPYVTKRWLGGTLTNFRTIQKSIEKLEELKTSLTDEAQAARLTKKEKSVRQKEVGRLESVLEGIRTMRRLPAAVVVIGAHDEKIAIREANRMHIPVIGICDTNADPSFITYNIPGNDDAVRSLELITSVLAKAVDAGHKHSI